VTLPGLAALEAAIEGTVALPGSPDDVRVRKPAWAQFADIEPAAVVLCTTPADVAETIAFARRLGLTPVARCGGHCFAGRSSTTGIVIDVSPMSSVDVGDGVATIGAGALLGDIYKQLEAVGLTIAAGACPSVGIAGLTLGGGLGILGRTYGLTSDQLVAARVVLADGRVVECDEQRDSDLFWALRGPGGGQFGVVTVFAFRTVPAHDLTCFKLSWPFERAAAAIDAWQSWAPDAPDELAASLLLNAPADLREPLVTLFGAMIGPETETASTVDDFSVRLGAEPHSTTLEHLPHGAAKRFLAEHAPGAEGATEIEASRPVRMFSKSEFFRRPLPRKTIEALVDTFAAARAPGQARELDFTPWAGAYNRVPLQATAFAHRAERFLLKHAVVLDADASRQQQDAARDWLARSWSCVHRHGSGGSYPSFPDPELDDWETAYHGINYQGLTRIKARYDRDNVFRFDQSIPPAGR
jgi:FAD/FMN-containing dehydrogenase